MNINRLKKSGYHDREVMRHTIMTRLVNGDDTAQDDLNLLDEYEKAVSYVEQYTTNTIRIRRLLDQSPVTFNNGQALINNDTKRILVAYTDRINNPLYPYINHRLLYP